MRRVIVIAVAGLGLAGCSSFSSFSLDSFKSAPPTVNVQLDSVPQGAEARTSLGPSCKTPCSLPVPAEGGFSVSFALNKFAPVTIPVQVTHVPGDFTTPASTSVDPNPVVAELQPLKPLKPPPRKMVRKRKPAAAAAPAAGAAPAETSPFPPAAAPPPR
jgi:hypothetical protein